MLLYSNLPALNAELMHRPDENLSIYDIGRLVNITHAGAMTLANIISGFCRTEISAFDENIFEKHEFFGSAVTDWNEMQEVQAEDITVAAEGEIIAMYDDALTLEPSSSEALAIVPRQLLDSDTVLCGSTEKTSLNRPQFLLCMNLLLLTNPNNR